MASSGAIAVVALLLPVVTLSSILRRVYANDSQNSVFTPLSDFYAGLQPESYRTDYKSLKPDTDEERGTLTLLDQSKLAALRSRSKDGAAIFVRLAPCSIAPHYHPRSTEWYVPLKGRLLLRTLLEADQQAEVIQSEIGPGELGIIPPAYLHSTINPTCEEAEFVTFYPEGDPGLFLAQQLYQLTEPEIRAITGQEDVAIAGRKRELGTTPPVFLPFDCTTGDGALPYSCDCPC